MEQERRTNWDGNIFCSKSVGNPKMTDIDTTKKIRQDIFRALLKVDKIPDSKERDVLMNELRRAKLAVAQLLAVLGDKNAYTTKD